MNNDAFDLTMGMYNAFVERVGEDKAAHLVIAHHVNMLRIELSASRKQLSEMKSAMDRISVNTKQMADAPTAASEPA